MGKVKKILMLAPSPLYLEKGSSLRMYAIAEILSKKYNIDLLTYSTGKDFKLKNTKVHRTPKFYKPELEVGKPSFSKVFLDFMMLLKAIKLYAKNDYDIIHCEDFEGAFMGYLLTILGKKRKLVYDLHNRITDNLSYDNRKSKIIKTAKFLEKKVVKKSDLMILNWNKYSKDKIFADKRKFLFYDKINLSLEKYHLPLKGYIVYVGNFKPYQGLKEFLEVYKDIDTKIKLVLIGQPSDDIKEFVKSDKKLKEKVIFTGRLSILESNYLIKNSKFAILPRLTGSSMKVIAYLMLEKPVLAKNTLSNRELVKEGFNGFLYSNNKELKEKFARLIKGYKNPKIKKGVQETKKMILNIWNEKRFLKEYER